MALGDGMDEAMKNLAEKKVKSNSGTEKKEGDKGNEGGDQKNKDGTGGDGGGTGGDGGSGTEGTQTVDIELPDEKIKEIRDKITADNEGKKEDEIKALIDSELEIEKTRQSSQENIKKKFEEVQGRSENKDKSEEEINKIVTSEIRSLKKDEPGDKGTGGDAPTQKSIDELLSTQTNGKYAKIEDLIALAEREEPEFASERIKKFNELEKSGVDILSVLSFGALGIDKLDPANLDQAKQILKHNMKLENPGISDDEMEYELKNRYKLDIVMDDEEKITNQHQVDMETKKLLREAGNTKDKLLKKQKELEIPESDATSKATTAETARIKDEADKKWKSEVNTSLEGFGKIELELEGTMFEFLLDDTKKTSLKGFMEDPIQQLVNRYNDENGQTDMAKLRQEYAILQNLPALLEEVWKQAKSVGAEEIILNTSNYKKRDTTSGTGGLKTESTPKSPAAAMAEAHKKSGELN